LVDVGLRSDAGDADGRDMRRRQLSALIVVAALASSCGSSAADPQPAAERTVASTTTPAPQGDSSADNAESSIDSALSSASDGGAIVDHGDLDPEAVVVAAVLIASGGDLEAATADGWITEAEAEAARAGIEDGSLAALLD
jgi:hypothetical protein